MPLLTILGHRPMKTGSFLISAYMLLVGCLLVTISHSGWAQPTILEDGSGSGQDVYRCATDILGHVGQKPDSIDAIDRAALVCSKIMYWNFLIHDFEIRREKFEQQNSDDRILLWMVVSITVAGVLLSGLQLYVSFKIANPGKGPFESDVGEVSIEKGKLSVKSSVTGLLILAISFAFFIVFVIFVYQFKEDKVSYPEQLAPTSGVNLGGGGIGPPNKAPSSN